MLAGSYPAFYLSSFNPIKTVRGTFRSGKYTALPRKILVIFQFTISIALIIGTMIVHQHIQHVKNRPVGYTREGLIELRPRSPEYQGKYFALRNELKKTGVVYEMCESNYPVTNTLGWNPFFDWKGNLIENGTIASERWNGYAYYLRCDPIVFINGRSHCFYLSNNTLV